MHMQTLSNKCLCDAKWKYDMISRMRGSYVDQGIQGKISEEYWA